MFRSMINKPVITSRIAHSSARRIHTTRPRFESYRPNDPTKTTSESGNKTYAIIAALVLGVGGYYGLMMGSPRTAVPDNKSSTSMSGTSETSKRANESARSGVNPNNPQ
ncbi:hypothetical protein QBC42DRAFT_348394 [Cladorrhinum samala]|uniref:Uncharacterized protein n=1 Tax=Cladorrhinum samala TaxID=585594 RepID=A0AAV9HIS6_9PEZI|nr:hypothetical protein QBC42DRAFT_348394 [Cladorrhinum samala]